MRKTANVMYTIAKWFNFGMAILYAALVGLFTTFCIIYTIRDGVLHVDTLSDAITCFLALIFVIVCFIVIGVAKKKQAENAEDRTPHVLCIVFGVLGSNPFYIVGAILNLILQGKKEEQEPIQTLGKSEQAEEKAE